MLSRIRELETRALDEAAAGRLVPAVTTFPLAEAAAAHTALETRATIGKVVLVPRLAREVGTSARHRPWPPGFGELGEWVGAPDTVRAMGDLIIPTRFNGPPTSGNGGYTCGALAVVAGAGLGSALEVTLRRPPPLDRELWVESRADGTTAARDGDDVVAEARPATVDLTPPGAQVSVEEAAAADARSPYRDAERHPFATCFVCGPRRPPGDGLRLFAGPLPDGRHATVFRPHGSLADGQGVVAPEVVWAALDCPSSAPLTDWTGTRQPSVLARLRARVDAALRVGEEYVALSWMLGEDGRKRRAGSALLTAGGEPVAVAEALWIELRAPT